LVEDTVVEDAAVEDTVVAVEEDTVVERPWKRRSTKALPVISE
jgi:hypothetical protein